MLATVAEVTGEALAEASRVVADAAARAVAALLVTVAEEHIRAGRAFFQGAVRASEAKIAHAAHVLHCIPRSVVSLVSFRRELLLSVADATARAIVRAHGTLARNAVIIFETLALARLAVAETFVGAFYFRVSLVGSRRHRHPGRGLRASARRAIVFSEGKVAVWPEVARALVVGRAGAVTGAAVLGRRRTRHTCRGKT